MKAHGRFRQNLSGAASHPTARTALVIAITAMALILRLLSLGSRSLWLDEAATAQTVTSAWPRFELLMRHNFPLMSLYYAILYGWTTVAGSSEFALRFPSAVFSTLTVPVVYMLGDELFDRQTGALAAALMAINLSAIVYAQEVRSYALLVCFACLSALFFVRTLRSPSTANCMGYVVFGVLSVYTHLFGILILPAELVSLWLFKPGQKATLRLTTSAVIFGFLALPAFVRAMTMAPGPSDWIPPTNVHSVLAFFRFEDGGPGGRSGLLLQSLYGGGILAALAFALSGDSRRNQIWFLALCAFVPVALTIVVSLAKPLFIDRYLIECLPFTVTLVAAGIMLAGRFVPQGAIFAVVTAMIVLGLYDAYPYYRSPSMENWGDAVAYVAEHERPGDAVIVYRAECRWPVDYYRQRFANPMQFPKVVYPDWNSAFRLGGHGIESRFFQGLDPYLSKAVRMPHERVWLILSHVTWPAPHRNAGPTLLRSTSAYENFVLSTTAATRTVREELSGRYGPPKVRKFSGVEVALFSSAKTAEAK